MAEKALTERLAARLDPVTTARVQAVVGDEVPDEPAGEPGPASETAQRAMLARIKDSPGNVSLESMLTEIDKLLAVRSIGLPPITFDDVVPKDVSGWRGRASIEWPSHLREHPEALRLTLLAALLHEREHEITGTLVDLLIATVHRIGARAGEARHRGVGERIPSCDGQGTHPVQGRRGLPRAPG